VNGLKPRLAAAKSLIELTELSKTFGHFLHLDVPIGEKVVRSAVVYIFLVVALRLAGKRELGQSNTMDLVVLLTLSNTVQNAIIGPDNSLLGGLIGAFVLLACNALVVAIAFKYPKVSKILNDEPIRLMSHGQLNKECLAQEKITTHELEESAQEQGYASLDEVETAILEPSGKIAFIRYAPSPEELRHQELLKKLDTLSKELDTLKAERSH
jgi:uncharacterized membrane protein YcaP (DUF421 family)